jgi:hypothetical protein
VKGKPERRVFVNLGVDGGIRLRCTLRNNTGVRGLCYDRDKWRAILHTVMKF